MLIRTVCYEFFLVMAILEILKYPDPLLHKVAAPVKNITGKTAQLIEDMLDTMGLQVDLSILADPSGLALGGTLIITAIIGKLVCGLGVVGPGIRRLAVGIGMIPRGEVGLIFAGIGARVMLEGEPILNENVYSSVVLMALITTIITPVGLRRAFKD